MKYLALIGIALALGSVEIIGTAIGLGLIIISLPFIAEKI